MASTYTLNNGIELIGTGEQSGTWGDTTNTNFELLDTSLDGQVSVTLSATGSTGSPNTLPVSDGAASNGRNRLVIFGDGGDIGGTVYVQLTPNDAEKIIYVRNNLSGSRSILLFQGTYNASNDYEVPAGTTAVVFFNGAGTGAVAANVFNNAHFDGLNVAGNLAIGGNATFGDNDKAIFGAGSDLQIYHDGSNSYIQDVGTGGLYLKANSDFYVQSQGTDETFIQAASNAFVKLFYNGSEKLATTSTGVNVTGTVTADGLTVDGTTQFDNYGSTSGKGRIQFGNSGQKFIEGYDTGNAGSGSYLKFGSGSTTQMTLDNSGNVGIGTSSPASLIHGMSGDLFLTANSTSADSGQGIYFQSTTSGWATSGAHGAIFGKRVDGSNGYLRFDTRSGGTLTEAMRIDSSGNVGIGTSSPSTFNGTGSKLAVGSGAGNVAALFSDATYYTLGIKHTGVGSEAVGMFGGTSGSALALMTNNTERLRIDSSSGDVGIGITSYTSYGSRLTVSENGGSSSAMIGCVNTATSGTRRQIDFFDGSSNTRRGSIQTDGSNTSFNTSSDYRLKENVSYSWDATTRLKQLKPARFNFIADANKTIDGFLAHEVSSVIPSAVSGEKDAVDENGNIDPQSIDHSKLVPLLVKTIQELEARIDSLETRLTALEGA